MVREGVLNVECRGKWINNCRPRMAEPVRVRIARGRDAHRRSYECRLVGVSERQVPVHSPQMSHRRQQHQGEDHACNRARDPFPRLNLCPLSGGHGRAR
jgi:hypothetical protein